MKNIVYILTFAPNEEHCELTPLDGFNSIIGVFSFFSEAMDYLKTHAMEEDEIILDFDIHDGDYDYFYTNYGAYRIEKTVVR